MKFKKNCFKVFFFAPVVRLTIFFLLLAFFIISSGNSTTGIFRDTPLILFILILSSNTETGEFKKKYQFCFLAFFIISYDNSATGIFRDTPSNIVHPHFVQQHSNRWILKYTPAFFLAFFKFKDFPRFFNCDEQLKKWHYHSVFPSHFFKGYC